MNDIKGIVGFPAMLGGTILRHEDVAR